MLKTDCCRLQQEAHIHEPLTLRNEVRVIENLLTPNKKYYFLHENALQISTLISLRVTGLTITQRSSLLRNTSPIIKIYDKNSDREIAGYFYENDINCRGNSQGVNGPLARCSLTLPILHRAQQMPPIPNSYAPQPIRDVLDSIEQQFELSDEKLREITAHFVKMYQLGLQHGHEPMAMIPTYVTAVPDGSETG